MTAEIAILNKTAVALAADSAVTISAGSNQEKIYDSADKLFELCSLDAIGAMVNGGMHFVQIPLAVLIKKFRAKNDSFGRVTDAAEALLVYLNSFAETASAEVQKQDFGNILRPILNVVKSRFDDRYLNRYFGDEGGISQEYAGEDGYARARSDTLREQLAVMRSYLESQPAAEFIGNAVPAVDDVLAVWVLEFAKSILPDLDAIHMEDAGIICRLALERNTPFQPSTGLVIAGYGRDDLFPTLVSFELLGAPCGCLKFARANLVDIDRDGDRARVIPFAQREMVERFLYGLDESIQRDVSNFCRGAVPRISESILAHLEMAAEEKAALASVAEEAEAAFLDGLKQDSFEAIRQQSRTEIEDMVEFMPKPEMARMAEALVNLTSIKRRVTRGMETVGGPIDVAVISQAEGFVWVKRKHYFPPELNSRFFDRMGRHGKGDGE
ncbi:hypothetical protein [Sphingobium phenoxybenzoativorans]|uniref:hypothetical protein n=1 Tax=Sphingobium phenoxybenzoativorans TaxID=1592790 RepID=UPI000A4985B6|nr:hypothetical protein [Sphingobium phenoxybenzoativorans]